jgi:hypothetical protein
MFWKDLLREAFWNMFTYSPIDRLWKNLLLEAFWNMFTYSPIDR